MPLGFPLSTNEFAEVIRMSTVRMRLVADQQISGMGGGEIIVADLAPKYWEFEVSLINMENADARRVQALIESLDESINTFNLYDPRAEYPIKDPDGSELGGANPKIGNLAGNNKELQIVDLPADYKLSTGDMFHFNFGDPSKRALHRIVTGGTASGSGVLSGVEVRPHILPGAEVDTEITLIRPSARVRIIPGSFDPGTARQMMTTGMSFKCRQVF